MAKAKSSEDINTQSLADQMTQLAALVERLEDPDLPLEEALTLYEQGIKLSAAAQKILDLATQRVAMIRDDEQQDG
jgi:exodeoxyribonuclease VII small subunit